MASIIEKLPPFARKHSPCTRERFKEIIQQTMEDPTTLLHRRVIVFRFCPDEEVLEFCFTRIENIICDLEAYQETDNTDNHEKKRPTGAMLHLYVTYGTSVPAKESCFQRMVYLEVDHCFADFIDQIEESDDSRNLNIPANFYLYALLP
jgi:hypothetical protein